MNTAAVVLGGMTTVRTKRSCSIRHSLPTSPRTVRTRALAQVRSPTGWGRKTIRSNPKAAGSGWMPATQAKNHSLTDPNMG